MKAIVMTEPCEAMAMKPCKVDMPAVRPGMVLIRVKAFGLNHSEVLLRKFEISQPYIKKPVIPGIECVGTVADPSDSSFGRGQKVMAMMGGMGRSFNGSYAEYALVPANHVFAVESEMDWAELGAIPETYYTAYGSLTESLQLTAEDTLLIRGGSSTVGIAAIQLAKGMGAKVVATTRSEMKARRLKDYGADDVVCEGEDFGKRFLKRYPSRATKILELIGASTLRESLKLCSRHGIVCHTGLLGGVYGLEFFDPIKEIPSGVYLTGFYSNNPSQGQIDRMMDLIRTADIHPVMARVFSFNEIGEAHVLAEEGGMMGKIVIVHDEQ